jgi:UDP-2,3-diacylglucosamine pyrophosphatase LpxH
MGNLTIQREMIYESAGKKFLIVHGDIFDSITSQFKWIAKLGDIGYTFLLWLNRVYNYKRLKKGLPYFSLSQAVKGKVKQAVKYIDDFEHQLSEMAKYKGCDGIICGHIHQPAIKEIDGVTYLNSGDWVESLTALIEDFNGEWSLVYYSESQTSNAKKEKEIKRKENKTIELNSYFEPNGSMPKVEVG